MSKLLEDFNSQFDPAVLNSNWRESLEFLLKDTDVLEKPFYKEMMDSGATLGDVCGLSKKQIDAALLKGMQLIQAGDLEVAAQWMQVVIMLDPLSSAAYYAMGTALQLGGQLKVAAQNYMIAAAMDAKNPQTYLRLGECHMSNKEMTEAVEYFDVAKAIAAGTAKAAAVKEYADRMISIINDSSAEKAD